MPKYLVSVHHPEDYDASIENEEMTRDIDVLNDEMVAAGIRVFVGGMPHPRTAKTLRQQPDGTVSVTNGPCIKAPNHVAGFWVLDVSDEQAALEWGEKAAKACRAEIEVRLIYGSRTEAN